MSWAKYCSNCVNNWRCEKYKKAIEKICQDLASKCKDYFTPSDMIKIHKTYERRKHLIGKKKEE